MAVEWRSSPGPTATRLCAAASRPDHQREVGVGPSAQPDVVQLEAARSKALAPGVVVLLCSCRGRRAVSTSGDAVSSRGSRWEEGRRGVHAPLSFVLAQQPRRSTPCSDELRSARPTCGAHSQLRCSSAGRRAARCAGSDRDWEWHGACAERGRLAWLEVRPCSGTWPQWAATRAERNRTLFGKWQTFCKLFRVVSKKL